jgi:nitroreductase
VWNILLAARQEGLAGVLTTYLSYAEAEVQQLLGLPEHYAVAAMVPLGHPVKQLTKLKRNSVEDFANVDRFDGAPFTA